MLEFVKITETEEFSGMYLDIWNCIIRKRRMYHNRGYSILRNLKSVVTIPPNEWGTKDLYNS